MGYFFKKVYKVTKFNQNAWLKPYIDMNTDVRKKAKRCWKMIYLSWWMMQFLENLRKHREIKLIRTERRRNCLLSEPNYHTTKFFTENVSWIAMRKTQILISICVYRDLSILDLSKTVMYEFWLLLCKTKIWWKYKTLSYRYT